MNWLSDHWQFLFGGVGGTALVAFLGWLLRSALSKTQPANLTTDSALASGSHISQRVNSPDVNVTFPLANADTSARAEKHLEDIKARVVEPLDQWLGVVVCITRGLGDAVKFVAEPMGGVGGQHVYRLEPVSIADAEGFSSALFDDARKSHFPEQLEKFVPLRRNLEQLLQSTEEYNEVAAAEPRKRIWAIRQFRGYARSVAPVLDYWARTRFSEDAARFQWNRYGIQ